MRDQRTRALKKRMRKKRDSAQERLFLFEKRRIEFSDLNRFAQRLLIKRITAGYELPGKMGIRSRASFDSSAIQSLL
jgi:hypothetical protein